MVCAASSRLKEGDAIAPRNCDLSASMATYGIGMPTAVDRPTVERLVAEGAQLIEVLPPAEYEDEHLPGAINLPLKQIDAAGVGGLDPGTPIVVYCWDAL